MGYNKVAKEIDTEGVSALEYHSRYTLYVKLHA
jgi:hypothetical protein